MEDTVSDSSHTRRVAIGTIAGSLIEWYDFFIFGSAAALVFGRIFFPSYSAFAGTLLSLATFATAWVLRPVGGIVFGVLGDRIGRKSVLLITVVGMGIATTLIGLIPSYASIGVWAPILVVVFRMLQGLFAGGEWSGAATLSVESATRGRRGLFGSFPQLGIPLALILSQGVALIFYSLPEKALLSYGWRIPFLLSIVVTGVGYFLRRKIDETPAFLKAKESRKLARVPLSRVVKTSPRALLTVFFANAGMNSVFYTVSIFALSYATSTGRFEPHTVLTALISAAVVASIGVPICGALSDRVGRRWMYAGGMLYFTAGFFPFFLAISHGSSTLLIVAFVLLFGCGYPVVWAVAASFYTEQFPTATRYTGSSLAYQLSSTLIGAPLPIVGTALIAANDGSPWVFCAVVSGLTAIAAIAALAARETAHLPLLEDRDERSVVTGVPDMVAARSAAQPQLSDS